MINYNSAPKTPTGEARPEEVNCVSRNTSREYISAWLILYIFAVT